MHVISKIHICCCSDGGMKFTLFTLCKFIVHFTPALGLESNTRRGYKYRYFAQTSRQTRKKRTDRDRTEVESRAVHHHHHHHNYY